MQSLGYKLEGVVGLRKLLISVENSVLKASDPYSLLQFDVDTTLRSNWATGVLKYMICVKLKRTT